MHTYEVYLSGKNTPAWTYKTSKGFYNRLRQLAAMGAIAYCHVYVPDLDKWYEVRLNPSPDVTWSSTVLH